MAHFPLLSVIGSTSSGIDPYLPRDPTVFFDDLDPWFLIDLRIITRLEDHALNQHTYRLYHAVDPDALESFVDSGDADLEISFFVLGHRVAVTGAGTIDVEDR